MENIRITEEIRRLEEEIFDISNRNAGYRRRIRAAGRRLAQIAAKIQKLNTENT